MSKNIERTEMRSITRPGFAMQVDKAKYDAMKEAMLAAVPKTVPGLTVAEIKARGLIARENVKPLRLHRLSRRARRAAGLLDMTPEGRGDWLPSLTY